MSIFGLQGNNLILSASDSGIFTTNSSSFVSVTNMSVNITVGGKRPVLIGFNHGGSVSGSLIGVGTGGAGELQIKRDSMIIAIYNLNGITQMPPSSVSFMDTPSANNYSYTLEIRSPGGSLFFAWTRVKMYAMEL